MKNMIKLIKKYNQLFQFLKNFMVIIFTLIDFNSEEFN